MVEDKETMEKEEKKDEKSGFIRVLNSLLDGGRTGVDVGLAIIPGGADHFHAGDGAHLRPLIVGRVYRRGL